MNSVKHKNPFQLKVGDLFYWDFWEDDKDNPKQTYSAIVVKVNKKSVTLHFFDRWQARSCRQSFCKKSLYRDDPHKIRVYKEEFNPVWHLAKFPRDLIFIPSSEDAYFIGESD